jgi:hypothetical protein
VRHSSSRLYQHNLVTIAIVEMMVVGWAGPSWAGLGWAGLGWLGWAGLGWAGSVGRKMVCLLYVIPTVTASVVGLSSPP